MWRIAQLARRRKTDEGGMASGKDREAERQARLAAALRANLGRRKAQARARKAQDMAAPADDTEKPQAPEASPEDGGAPLSGPGGSASRRG
jgi:hypothetical protein